MRTDINWAELAPRAAIILLGEPDKREQGGRVWRWSGRGGLTLDVQGQYAGRFHLWSECDRTLGLLDMIRQQTGTEPMQWLADNGLVQLRKGGTARVMGCDRGKSGPRPAPVPEPQPLHATPLGEGVTVAEFFAGRHWLLSKGKGKPATARAGRAAWRQSREPKRGGILLARHGGVVQEVDANGRPYQLKILPWESYDRILELRDDPALRVSCNAEPMVSLAGDADTPCLSDYLLFDMDYHPEHDPAGVSAPVRDTVAQRLAAAGAALYYSRSGHGFHAVMRLAAEDIEAGRRPRRKRATPGQLPGLAFDMFLPGDKSPLNLSRERPNSNASPDHILPVVTLTELDAVLRGEECGDVGQLLDEAAQKAKEPEYAVLLVQMADELAAEGQATEAERERLERAKQYFVEVMR